MSDGMERVMREIHVMFAKAEKLSSREDMVIVDKKKVFALLEALNHEVYDAMDRYEESKVSRELAVKKLKEETDAMVEKASGSAEEVYAASILYSDSTLKELEQEVEHARANIRETWENIDRQISDKLHYLEKNRSELKSQLERMEQGRIYLDLIGRAKRDEAEEQAEQKRLNRAERTEKRKAQTEKAGTEKTGIEKTRIEKAGTEKTETEKTRIGKTGIEKAGTEKAETGKTGIGKTETGKTGIEKIRAEKKTPQTDRVSGLTELTDSDDWDVLDLDEEFEESGLTEEQRKIEIHVAEAYKDRIQEKKTEPSAAAASGFRAEDFDLDAEYFAWKEEINGAPPPAYPSDVKKGLKNIFKRVK